MRVLRNRVLALAGLAVVGNMRSPADAADQPVSTAGHWHVDFDRSSDPYTPHPKSVILDVLKDNERTYEATETVIGVDGKTKTERIQAQYGGKPYPVEGSPNNITVSVVHLAGASKRIELDSPNGFHAVIVCTVSGDLNVMTCDETDADPKGQSTQARSVYVRDAPPQQSR